VRIGNRKKVQRRRASAAQSQGLSEHERLNNPPSAASLALTEKRRRAEL